jgi:4a-hydroxytetrahydrobiopterin dehydratase
MSWETIQHNDGTECLRKEFISHDFKEAFSFLRRVAFIAEKMNHHPKIINLYNRVELELNTHDAGNKITDKDLKLSQFIDEIV